MNNEISETTFSGVPAPAPAPTADSEVADLTQLIASAEKKLAELRAANYVADNARAEQAQIVTAEASLAQIDSTIERFEGLSADALQKIDAACEAQLNGPATGAFGMPVQLNSHLPAAATYAGLRYSLAQHRRTRARQTARIDDLRRVQAQHLPLKSTT